ncbi:MAG TPA: (2Fe-2S)-binding protein, partial [Woeseiaceae bacterium]|nr:(2Fe-2S)-binding protein [Woeseiaceae bacterium]
MAGRFVRIAAMDRKRIDFEIDGEPCSALEGDTLIVAVLTNKSTLRLSEFGDGSRAGFCLMGACQDCWMWTAQGERLRACTTVIESGMRVITAPPSEEI